jgi:hypothetical protein
MKRIFTTGTIALLTIISIQSQAQKKFRPYKLGLETAAFATGSGSGIIYSTTTTVNRNNITLSPGFPVLHLDLKKQ